MANEESAFRAGAPRPIAPAPGAEAPAQFATDASSISTVYTNFCRVNVTPEELVLDFGLNTHMTPTAGADPIKLTHRVVMNFFTAKRLMNHLIGLISHHENIYGQLELDIQKRMRVRPNLGGLGQT